MTVDAKPRKGLKVAIIGGGPGGLAVAIVLSKLPFVTFDLYEKKPQISETGGGISLQRHTWRLLELLGAAKNISPEDFFRNPDGTTVQHRNGRTGALLAQSLAPADTPPGHGSCRMVRPRLQNALLREVDPARIHVGKKLVGIAPEPSVGGAQLTLAFADGTESEGVDLLVGADGIRSAVRAYCFPRRDALRYNGQSAFRALVPAAAAREVEGLPWSAVFWHNLAGKYVFTCPLGLGADAEGQEGREPVFEVTARIRRPAQGQEAVSWGRPFDMATLLDEYVEFAPPVRAALQLAADSGAGGTQEFALFSGDRLARCVGPEGGGGVVNVALVGDAGHPLSGAFGAGAGFAFEDAWTLGRALQWALGDGETAASAVAVDTDVGEGKIRRNGSGKRRTLADALELYDRVRSPHYAALHGVLDKGAAANAAIAAEGLGVDEEIEKKVNRLWDGGNGWMYYHKADEVVEKAILEAEAEEEAGVVDRDWN